MGKWLHLMVTTVFITFALILSEFYYSTTYGALLKQVDQGLSVIFK